MSSTSGTSAWSDEDVNGGATFSTYATPSILTVPLAGSPINGVSISSKSATLSWYLPTAPKKVQSYRIEVSKNPNNTTNPIF